MVCASTLRGWRFDTEKAEEQKHLPSITWESIWELCYCRPVTNYSRGAGWAFVISLQSPGNRKRAFRAGEWIASARGAVVARRTKIASGSIALRKGRKNKNKLTLMRFVHLIPNALMQGKLVEWPKWGTEIYSVKFMVNTQLDFTISCAPAESATVATENKITWYSVELGLVDPAGQ